jgi:hypothetical protein
MCLNFFKKPKVLEHTLTDVPEFCFNRRRRRGTLIPEDNFFLKLQLNLILFLDSVIKQAHLVLMALTLLVCLSY